MVVYRSNCTICHLLRLICKYHIQRHTKWYIWNCYSFEITSVSCFRYQNKRRQHTYSWYRRHKKHTHRHKRNIVTLLQTRFTARSQKLKLHWSTVKLELYWYYFFLDCMSKCIKANDKSEFIIAALEQDRFIYSAALLFWECVLENHTSENFSIYAF